MIKSKRGWMELCGNVLFVLALVPCLLMLYESMHIGVGSDAGLWLRIRIYIWASVCLGTISAVLVAVSRVWFNPQIKEQGNLDP